jgi:beta-glucosidase
MPDGQFLGENLNNALDDEKVSEKDVDKMVRRLARVMFEAGLFDESVATYGGLSNTEERQALALEVARKSIVLLKNEKQLLPLDQDKIKSIAVLGPNADEARMFGGGSGYLNAHYSISPLMGIKEKVADDIRIKFVKGGRLKRLSLPAIDSALLIPSGGQKGDHGLLGEYFNNRELEGEPVLTRIDKQVDFSWDASSPAPGVVKEDLFSARWTGTFISPGSGIYELGVMSDNGCRLYLDDKLVIDSWIVDKASSLRSIYIELEKNRHYKIQVEFFENVGTCEAHLGLAYYGERNEIEQAVDAAAQADVAIIYAGLRETLEGEGNDRQDLNLPKDQVDLIMKVAKVNPATVVVLNNATPLLMDSWIEEVPAIIEAFYPGQEGGNALADIIFGDVNPSGKLPLTFIKSWEDSPVYATYPGSRESVYYSEGLNIGYRHFDKVKNEPLFPFGYGLSYTSFSYQDLDIKSIPEGDEKKIQVNISVKNSGERDGDEIIQLYLQRPDDNYKQLKGFARINLKPGETKNVDFILNENALSYYDKNKRNWMIKKGNYSIFVGSSSQDIRLKSDVYIE